MVSILAFHSRAQCSCRILMNTCSLKGFEENRLKMLLWGKSGLSGGTFRSAIRRIPSRVVNSAILLVRDCMSASLCGFPWWSEWASVAMDEIREAGDCILTNRFGWDGMGEDKACSACFQSGEDLSSSRLKTYSALTVLLSLLLLCKMYSPISVTLWITTPMLHGAWACICSYRSSSFQASDRMLVVRNWELSVLFLPCLNLVLLDWCREGCSRLMMLIQRRLNRVVQITLSMLTSPRMLLHSSKRILKNLTMLSCDMSIDFIPFCFHKSLTDCELTNCQDNDS